MESARRCAIPMQRQAFSEGGRGAILGAFGQKRIRHVARLPRRQCWTPRRLDERPELFNELRQETVWYKVVGFPEEVT